MKRYFFLVITLLRNQQLFKKRLGFEPSTMVLNDPRSSRAWSSRLTVHGYPASSNCSY
jgi:hypothetical protein